MTIGRWFGPALLDRYGRVPVLRTLAGIGLAGLLLFVFGPVTPVAFAGAVLWGLGASLGFPVGMSAAADDPAKAAARVSVVASIGYCAFLGGPPLIGFLGDHYTVVRGLLAVAMLLVISILVAGSIRPLQRCGRCTASPPELLGLLGPVQVDDRGGRAEVLVAAQVADRLDVEGLGEQLRVAVAHPRQSRHGRVDEVSQGLVLVRLVENLCEVCAYRHELMSFLRS
jgi:MFS family permease